MEHQKTVTQSSRKRATSFLMSIQEKLRCCGNVGYDRRAGVQPVPSPNYHMRTKEK